MQVCFLSDSGRYVVVFFYVWKKKQWSVFVGGGSGISGEGNSLRTNRLPLNWVSIPKLVDSKS